MCYTNLSQTLEKGVSLIYRVKESLYIRYREEGGVCLGLGYGMAKALLGFG